MRTVGFSLVVVGALLGCKAFDKEKPAPAASAVTPAGATPGVATGSKAAARPKSFSLKPLAVGQFVEYRLSGKAKKGERYSWAVTGAEGKLFWLQLISDVEGKGEAGMQMLVDAKDGYEIDRVKPKKLRMKMPGGRVQEVGAGMLAMAGGSMNKNSFFLDMSQEKVASGSREDVSVKSGSFPGSFKWKGKTKYKSKQNITTFWSHPSVPITGIAKANDGTRTWELVEYGLTGAKKEF